MKKFLLGLVITLMMAGSGYTKNFEKRVNQELIVIFEVYNLYIYLSPLINRSFLGLTDLSRYTLETILKMLIIFYIFDPNS